MSNDTTKQSQDTKSTSQHPLWGELGHQFDNLLAVFLLILMTPSIVSLALIWQLANMLHKGRESVSTRAESVASTVKSGAEKYSTQALYLSSKSLKALSDVALRTALEVDQRLSTSQSGIKK